MEGSARRELGRRRRPVEPLARRLADGLRPRVRDGALGQPAGDRDGLEELPCDRAETEAGADDAGSLGQARDVDLAGRGRARSGARAAAGSASGPAGRRPG